MLKTTPLIQVLCFVILLIQMSVSAQSSLATAHILWYADWETGLKEATRTGKPILLLSAAPHCRNVSGMW
ncbi:MAG: hypothetical protein AABZ60_22320 [Planctomycetota bacterium]